MANEFLEAALKYASFGWPVIPLRPKTKLPLTEHGLQDGTVDPKQIETWWSHNPHANVGVVTGVKFWALDVDPRHNGDITLDALESTYTKLPATIQQITGSGGRQYFFDLAPINITNTAGKVGQGIDTRGTGGYVVVPPSIHPETGRAYDWDGLEEIEEQRLLPAPQWLLQRLNVKPKQLAGAEKLEPFPDGQRNESLARMAGRLRNAGLSQAALTDALLKVNQERCVPPIEDEEVRVIAASISRYAPGKVALQAPPKDKEPKQKKEEPGLPFKKVTGVIEEYGGVEPYLDAKSKQGILSPWPSLDNETGGLRDGELIIVAASTSVGKSAFALNYALHAARAKTGVIFFSLEMSDVELSDRLLALAGGIELGDIKKGNCPDALQEAADSIHELPLYIVDCPGLTLPQMHATIKAIQKEADIGLTVCDYLQLMSGSRRHENRQQEVSAVSRGLKLAAKETGMPFLVLSQLTRAPGHEKRKPELRDLRDSGSIEQDANSVYFLYSPSDGYSDNPARSIPIELIVGKQRNGPRGKVIHLDFRRTLGRFWEKA